MRNLCLYLTLIVYCKITSANSGALFNVTNNTTPTGATLNITSTIPNRSYPVAGIKLNSNDYRLTNAGSECTKIENGYCLFALNNLSTPSISITGKVGAIPITLCLNGIGPLSCQSYQGSIRYAYVANDSGQILLCPINSNGDLGVCIDGGGSTAITGPNVIAFNASKTMAYVTNSVPGSGSVFLCDVQSDYTLDACNMLTNTSMFPFQVPFGIVFNKSQTKAYIPNGSDQHVLICSLNMDGTFSACQNSGNTGIPFGYPLGLVFNKAQTKAYVTNNGNHTVSICPIQSNGTFGDCEDSGNTGIAFSSPLGIVLNGSETKAYITNTSANTVSICPMQNDGTFGACIDSGDIFDYPIWIALNSDETKAYVTNNANSTVSICPLNIDGSFGVCQNANHTGISLFNGPEGIVLNQ